MRQQDKLSLEAVCKIKRRWRKMFSPMKLQIARDMASVWHENQLYGNKPYTYHLDKVEEKVVELFPDEPILRIVAQLHDTLEDTSAKYEMLLFFGEDVANAVAALTKISGENRHYYIKRVKLNSIAKKVKIADSTSNLLHSLSEGDSRRVLKYSDNLSLLYS